MVQVLPGIGDEASQGLGQIVDAIGQITNPNAKFQQAAKALFLEKPELMQKFVDVEKANPGTLKAMGFGDAGTNLLQGMHESIPAIQARVLAPKIAGELQKPQSKAVASAVTQSISGQTPGQLETDDVSTWMAKTGLKLFQTDPEAALEVMQAKFGVKSPEDRLIDKAKVPIAQAQGTAAQGALDAMTAAKPFLEMPPMDQVKAVVDGTMTGSQVAGILHGPGKLGFDAAMEIYKQDRALTVQQLSARYLGTQNDPLARARMSAATDAWKAHDGKGSVQGWYNHMFPDHAGEIGQASAQDAPLIASAMQDAQFNKRTEQIGRVMKAIEPDIKSITEAKTPLTPGSVNTKIANINSILKANGSEWEAVANAPGGFIHNLFNPSDSRWKITYKNKAGEMTDDPGALISNVPPTTFKAGDAAMGSLTGPQKAIANMLMGATGDARKAMITQLRQRDAAIAEQIITAAGGENPTP